ncbi:serine/threonine-protein phosphatase with EF-hands 1 [Pantherophis guttatus]|uniref:Serine/threonine-protein phosphatase n=1 Tax=Pantherophis guttatus TaxID=94885 RepID=A0A6P9DDC8_PANGU|nr:serine/threonine-protein phosphatase with EF-hands 1 [Pantherophis guttatus]
MGCGTSGTKSQTSKSKKAIKATILIQRWYRSYMARLEMRRRYSLTIFQSIEYADEQAQMQLSKFFTFMLDHFTQTNKTDPEISSHFFSTSSDYAISNSDHAMIEYERIIEVPTSYHGPHLCFPLTVADTEVLLQAFKDQQQLHARYVLQLFHETRKVLQQMPNINHLSTSYAKEVTICELASVGLLEECFPTLLGPPQSFHSDIVCPAFLCLPDSCFGLQQHLERSFSLECDLHGKLDDLLLIFYKNGLPSEENPYVFNGDFVDRGKNSMEILIILFAFLLVYPNHFHLNRGNHEDHLMNLRYGFTKEIMKKYKTYGKPILHLLEDVYSWLPLATIIDNQVLILHGGISDTTDLKFLNSFHRNKLKSLLRPVKSNMEAIYEPQKTSINLTESKKCNSGQDISKKNVIKSTSASCERRLNAKEVGDIKSNLDGTHNITSTSSFQNVQCLKPYNLITTNASPELTAKEREQVMDILWSDPKHQNGCLPNKIRGGGCYFGPDITARLLQRYNLKLLIRSHQCKQEGYEISHNGKVITIFSASNYYEEGSNRGAYIKLNPDLIPHFVQYQVSKSTCKQTLHQRVTAIEFSALKGLREKLYTHKSDLIAAFTHYDPICTGRISLSQWTSAMESVLNLDIPWRTLHSRLVCLASDGSVEYLSCFDNLEIILPIKEVQPYLVETLCRYKADLEIIFNMIDQDHSGLISADEFRQTWKLFNAHVKNDVSDESIDSLARTMDFNKDGSIDFNEFLEAFHIVHKFSYNYQLS